MKTTDENLDYRFNIIKEVTTNKYYSNKQAAEDLGVCPRTICRLKKQFDGSIESLVHGNYQNNYSRKYSSELTTKMVNFVKASNMQLAEKELSPLNYKHALFKVRQKLKINITYSSFVKFQREHEILKDYNLVNHSKLNRIMGKDKNTFTYMKHVYHLVDNNGIAVTFDERTEVELFYYKYN